MKKYLLFIGLILFSNFALGQSALKVNSIEFKANFYKYKGLLIDVRTPQEFSEGHLEGAKNIDITSENFEAEIEKIDKNQALFVYCAIGVRSGRAAAFLRKKGFKNVIDLNGGYEDLLKVGMKNANK
jgi:phage shock protein E